MKAKIFLFSSSLFVLNLFLSFFSASLVFPTSTPSDTALGVMGLDALLTMAILLASVYLANPLQLVSPTVVRKYSSFISAAAFPLFLLSVVLALSNSATVFDALRSGFDARNVIALDSGSSYFETLLIPAAVSLCAASLAISSSFRIVILNLASVFLCSITNLSKSEFATLFFLSLALLSVSSSKSYLFPLFRSGRGSSWGLLFLLPGLLFFFSFIMSIIQGRIGSDLGAYTSYILPRVLGFKGSAFFLFDRANSFASANEQLIYFSLLGDIATKFINPFLGLDTSSVFSSSDFYSFGPSGIYQSNVFYPWSAFAYGAFGSAGLAIKSLVTLFLLIFFVKKKFFLSYCNWLSFVLFTSPFGFPFLSSSGFYAFAIIFLLDQLVAVRPPRFASSSPD